MIRKYWMPAVLVTAMLAACGGSGGDDDQASALNNNPPAVGSSTGVFTDAPVAGLSYVASPSGVRGVTDAAGQFNYNPGDRVTFTLGGLQLGVADGAANVTPADIGGNADVVTNLLVLLQSLDTDSNPDTITLPANLSATSLSTVSLTQAPADFADPAKNTALAASVPAGGSIVSPEAAQKHASDYFWSQAHGVWMIQPDNEAESVAFIRISANQDHDFDATTPTRNAFLLGDIGVAGPEDVGGGPGPESGYLLWNALNSELTTQEIRVDANGDWGLSDALPRTLKMDGGKLRFVETLAADDVFKATLTRVANDPAGLTGAWVLLRSDGSERFTKQTIVFTADNRYIMIDPIGDDAPDHPPCGGPGIEDGTFTAIGGVFTVTTVKQDTNGCAGLNDMTKGAAGKATLGFALTSDGKLELTEGGEVVGTLKRVSK